MLLALQITIKLRAAGKSTPTINIITGIKNLVLRPTAALTSPWSALDPVPASFRMFFKLLAFYQ